MSEAVAKAAGRLKQCFPEGALNYFNEFIAHLGANRHYGAACCKLGGCKTEEEALAAALEMLTIDCCESRPFEAPDANDRFHKYMQTGMNKLLGKAFTQKQYAEIYQRLGNGANRQLTIAFIRSGYDLRTIREKRQERLISMDRLLETINGVEYRARSLERMRGGNDVLRRLIPQLIAEQPVITTPCSGCDKKTEKNKK